ncbi:hypothetical protein ACIQC9_00905 [Brevundimonas sp. NPDC092305]|uniref:hypothetical protein n=1 Tax=Brevundimonas sp. NPDC092305 TaxID=3363957 RepID=UPI0037F55B22
MTRPPNGFLSTALLAGVVAGALDIAAAVIQNGQVTAQVVFQSVASGWLGAEAYRGGWSTAWLGLASHFAMMFGIAAIYVLLAMMLPFLRRHWLVSAALWGVLVWVVMTWVVVPLSASPLPSPDIAAAIRGVLTHVFAVGLPMAAIVRWRMGGGHESV